MLRNAAALLFLLLVTCEPVQDDPAYAPAPMGCDHFLDVIDDGTGDGTAALCLWKDPYAYGGWVMVMYHYRYGDWVRGAEINVFAACETTVEDDVSETRCESNWQKWSVDETWEYAMCRVGDEATFWRDDNHDDVYTRMYDWPLYCE